MAREYVADGVVINELNYTREYIVDGVVINEIIQTAGASGTSLKPLEGPLVGPLGGPL